MTAPAVISKNAFVSASFAHKDALAPVLDAIAAALAAVQIQAHIFVRAYHFGPDDQRAMMAKTQADLRAADLQIAVVTYKAIGVGIEIGYAAALDMPVIVVRSVDAEPSTTAEGIADAVIVYDTPADLHARLEALLGELFPDA